MLIECLVYIAVLALLLGTFMHGFFQCWDDSKHLRRDADEIVHALHAGEQWRADVRLATAPPQWLHQGNFDSLSIPVKAGSINYCFFNTEGTVTRQVGTAGKSVTVLENVKSSRMLSDPRQQVTAWRWEVELLSAQKKVRMLPLFTFETVTSRNPGQ